MTALADPQARLEQERPRLTAFVEAAAAAGLLDYAWLIPRAAWQRLYLRGYMDDIRDLHLLAMAKVEPAGDRPAIASIANYLASAYSRAGEYAKAERYLLRSIELRDDLDNAMAYGNLASIYQAQGKFTEGIEAVRTCRRIAALSRSKGFYGLGALSTIAEILIKVGRHTEALYYTRLRLMASIDEDDPASTVGALLWLGRIRYATGAIPVARAHHYIDVAHRLAVRASYQPLLADIHNDRARLLRDEGRYAEADTLHRRALETVTPVRDSRHEVEFRYEHATTLRCAGDITAAWDEYQRSLRVARTTGMPHAVARALSGLAACLDPRDPEAARLRALACDLFDQMGIDTIDCGSEGVERG